MFGMRRAGCESAPGVVDRAGRAEERAIASATGPFLYGGGRKSVFTQPGSFSTDSPGSVGWLMSALPPKGPKPGQAGSVAFGRAPAFVRLASIRPWLAARERVHALIEPALLYLPPPPEVALDEPIGPFFGPRPVIFRSHGRPSQWPHTFDSHRSGLYGQWLNI
jgi:hypothetical protein